MTTLADNQQALRFLAAGLGSGWLPKAPGTWGSLVSLVPAWLLLEFTGVEGLLTAVALVTLCGCAVCFLLLTELEEKDPGWIVIDEWAGQWLCLAMVAGAAGTGWPVFVAAFAAFRLLDIAKPCPIPFFERWGPPWWGIMADDLVAGLLGGGILLILFSTLPGLV